MNRITLISAPIITEQTDAGTIERLLRKDPVFSVPQLGILTVAALFKKHGWTVKLSRIDKHYASHIANGKSAADFCDDFAAILANDESKYFGFSSICSSYYITLMVAERLKELRPDAIIVFGGPQASATGTETMSLSPAIDFVLCGEIELSLKDFLDCHLSAPDRVPGLCYRRNGVIISKALPTPPTLAPSKYHCMTFGTRQRWTASRSKVGAAAHSNANSVLRARSFAGPIGLRTHRLSSPMPST